MACARDKMAPTQPWQARQMAAVVLILLLLQLLSAATVHGNVLAGRNGGAVGLYSPQDDVEVLTAADFRERVYGREKAWLVEFYNTWCGFCQRFAASWKALATETKPWARTLSVGAVDCADDANSALCREYEIMGYPSLRYFHENYQAGIGADVKKGNDVDEMRYELLRVMMAEQQAFGRGLMFPRLSPYNHGNLKHLLDDVGPRVVYVFLVIDQAGSLNGPNLAMDFSSVPEIEIAFANFNNSELIHALGVKELPYMLVMDRSRKVQVFSEVDQLAHMRDAIVQYVKPEIKIDFHMDNVFRGKWLDVEVPDMATQMRQKEAEAIRRKIKDMGDAIYQVDLETALQKSLGSEVSAHKEIGGEKLQALRAFVGVLRKYFPFGPAGKRFLEDLWNLVQSRSVVDGKDIAHLLRLNEEPSRMVFSSQHSWMACEGSTSAKRGYPCGLWKLFHYLSVAAAHDADAAPKEVLYAMHGYVKNFFGCEDCSRHFQQMAAERRVSDVSTLDDAVLWLWAAHNVVNERLAGDGTEDPDYPKLQFPSPESCPSCRDAAGAWSTDDVLRYLKTMYSRHNIKYLGSDMRVLQLQQQDAEPHAHHQQRTHVTPDYSYGNFDSSMCFILYVFSFVLILVLIRMFLKRGYRKKMYAHDLLGKV